MKKLRIYIDTSVIGGCLDPEFAEASGRLFDQFRAGFHTAVVSTATLRELEGAPAAVRQVLSLLPEAAIEWVEETDEVASLAEAYVAAGVVPKGCRADAIHIASAVVHTVDILVSWNFKHIVNFIRIRRYNAVSLLQGYGSLEIRTPREVVDAE